MQLLRYSIGLTLDGCIDHQAGLPDEHTHAHATAWIGSGDHLVFGRKTYQLMEFWRPVAEGEVPEGMPAWMLPFAEAIGKARKYVVSDTLAASPGWNTTLIRSADLEATIRRLKGEPGRGILVGGVALPRHLAACGLIDEYEFIIQPRIAGHGPYLFEGLQAVVDLRLTGRREFPGGHLALTYRPAS